LGPILRASRKNGQLVDEGGMTRVAISIRVRTLGETIGVQGLSAHDCRHTWATHAVEQGTAPVALKEAGGWSTITTISRYFETAKLANGDVKLPY
jgi:integrase